MLNKISIYFIFMPLALLIFLPKAYASDEGHARHGEHSHRNPDLTLVSGMDNIDSRVLIASDPDQMPEDVDQPAAVVETTMPAIMVGSTDSFTVNVPNSSGGYTPVVIKKWGNGYIGPQGELYFPFPEISQLKAMYGI